MCIENQIRKPDTSCYACHTMCGVHIFTSWALAAIAAYVNNSCWWLLDRCGYTHECRHPHIVWLSIAWMLVFVHVPGFFLQTMYYRRTAGRTCTTTLNNVSISSSKGTTCSAHNGWSWNMQALCTRSCCSKREQILFLIGRSMRIHHCMSSSTHCVIGQCVHACLCACTVFFLQMMK